MLLRNALLCLFFLLSACAPTGGMHRLTPSKDNGVLIGIFVTPEEVVVPEGGTVQLVATGLYDNRETRDLTAVVTWKSANNSIASAGGLDGEGRFVGIAVGSTEVTARLDGVKSPPTLLTVTDQTVTSLSVEPEALVLEVGQQVELVATATFSDGSRSDATGLVRWITADGAVATLDGSALTAASAGSTTVHAQYEAVTSDDVPVDVLEEASADLRVASLSVNPYADSVLAVIEVENVGTAGASDFWVDAFVDFPGIPGPGDYGDAYERVTWCGPGQTAQVILEVSGLSDGLYDLTVSVDTEDEIDESVESNNHQDTIFSISASGGTTVPSTTTFAPDLAIDRVDFISDGTYVYYEVEISNYGDAGVGPFWVDVFVDQWASPQVGDDGDDWQEVSWIPAWSSVTIDFLIPADCSWGCDSWVFVDSYDDVSEPIEWDNIESVYVY